MSRPSGKITHMFQNTMFEIVASNRVLYLAVAWRWHINERYIRRVGVGRRKERKK